MTSIFSHNTRKSLFTIIFVLLLNLTDVYSDQSVTNISASFINEDANSYYYLLTWGTSEPVSPPNTWFTFKTEYEIWGVLAFSFSDDMKTKTDCKNVLAERLVTQCANVKENEIVLVAGGVKNIKLLEDIAIEVQKLGAFPLLSLYSDRLAKKYFDEVPPKYDSKFPLLQLKLVSIVDAVIQISSNEDQSILSEVSPERITDVMNAGKEIRKIWVDKGVKSVSLGNNLYPTADRAKMFKMSEEELAKVFWAGVNTDYKQLQIIGSSVKEILSIGADLHIINTNGTNLKISIKERPVHLSDGMISDEDIINGSTACGVWLPAGEVFLTPVLGTAEGKIIVDKHFYQGEVIEDLELVFKKGKLISFNAKSGLKPFEEWFNSAGEEKDLLSYLDFGINPNVVAKKDCDMKAWMQSGIVTIGIGDNSWAGGDIVSDFSAAFFLKESTVKVDGKTLIEGGNLKL